MFVEKENNLNETNSPAEKACRKALADAGYAFGVPASFHWSQLTNPNGEKQAAIDAYQTLLDQEQESKSALEGLAYLYQLMGHQSHAQYFRRKLKEIEARKYGLNVNEYPQVVEYLLAKTGEAKMPNRVPEEFVSAHFDKYSERFDSNLTGNLEYKGPELIHQLVSSIFSAQENSLQILDLGCGTGLIGEKLLPFTNALTGVDLSGLMLEKAAERRCYNKLIKNDCLSYLEENTDLFDLITASDLLIYLGDLSSLFSFVHENLQEDGLFVFTVENAYEVDYRLSNTGRYQHSANYIRSLAEKNRYQILLEEQVELRKEHGEAIDAKLFCLRV